jgi:hypothetical protein
MEHHHYTNINHGHGITDPGHNHAYFVATNSGGTYIRREREKGKSKTELARELGVTWITLDKYMNYQNIK